MLVVVVVVVVASKQEACVNSLDIHDHVFKYKIGFAKKYEEFADSPNKNKNISQQ